MLLYKKKVRVIFMINAMTALNMTEEAIKFKENIWNVIDKKIKQRANEGHRMCVYEVYPDSPIPVEDIVSKLEELGFDIYVEKYDEAELDFEVEFCHEVVIRW